ncbi:unnamed protein product [Vitrella brassicaformis CCMP3155]|uniref:Uncharacterized protein n=2 Tax=Vitrella brassicaformis TaxID=1169539 RepID=A0A0G4ED46_VITBC|nr:unnamed protein product [Vitrella brassicaformis CCMP3155]|mmetsp:Transcript_10469/g.25329  ORF Transcript_10469/g.25329 Transcript_10469/m.25329 type:complete len:285 (+) Transcript_10469:62-916(+)|eukprot:CEL93258.1 unnamed protein product [Vitrella brassicaformis CCMP3155]
MASTVVVAHHPANKTRNHLLVKDDVGRSKPTYFDLPGDSFKYGKALAYDREGAKEVTSIWVHHKPKPRPELRVQDFKKVNKMAIHEKLVTAKEQAALRKATTNVTIKNIILTNPSKNIPSDHNPSFVYGMRGRPSTPMARVIMDDYGRAGVDMLAKRYEWYDHEHEKAVTSTKQPKITRAAQGHASVVRKVKELQAAAHQKEMFKLKKYQQAGPKLETYATTNWRAGMAAGGADALGPPPVPVGDVEVYPPPGGEGPEQTVAAAAAADVPAGGAADMQAQEHVA